MIVLNKPQINIAITFSVGLLFAYLIVHSIYLASISLIGLIVLTTFSTKPLNALSLMIVLTPFTKMTMFEMNLLGVSGSKPIYILFLFVLGVALFNYKKSVRIPKVILMPYLILGGIFLLSIVGSVGHIDIFSSVWADDFNSMRYILSYGIRPFIYFLPLIFIVKFVRNKGDVDYVINALILSVTGVSLFLLYQYLFQVSDKSDLLNAREQFFLIFKLHGNDLANFYILSFPVLLARLFIKKDAISILGVCTSLPVIGILSSRTAYCVIFFSAILYCFLTKRTKYLPVVLAVVMVLFSSIAYQQIKERALRGLSSNDYNFISAGRIDGIWRPLMTEYMEDTQKIMFGQGRHSILVSESYRTRRVQVEHPHNMYFEQIIDSGIVGFIIVFSVFIYLWFQIKSSLKNILDVQLRDYQVAVYVAFSVYCISGLAGRSLYPLIHNSYLWILLGLAGAIIRITTDLEGKEYEKN